MLKLRTLIGLVAGVAALALPTAANAVPSFQIGSAECGAGIVRAFPPRSMAPTTPTDFRNPEMVHWTPELFRWNGSSWVQHQYYTHWFEAFTSSYGYFQLPLSGVGVWRNMRTNTYTGFAPFGSLTAGYYAVKNRLHWAGSGETAAFSPYCYVS